MSQSTNVLRLKMKARISSRRPGKKTNNASELLSMAWKFADNAFKLPGPAAVEQNMQHELGTQQLQSNRINLVGSSSEEDSPTFTDISGPRQYITLKSEDCMTFHSATDPTKGPTKLYKYAGLKDLHFRPQVRRQTPKETTIEPPSKAAKSSPPAMQVRVQLPVQDHLPIVMKFNQPIKFIVSQEVASEDESTKGQQNELVEYEFTSDSLQFSPTPNS